MCDYSTSAIGGVMKKKILICDDEIGVRKSLGLILSDTYDIVFADNGENAIKQLSQNPDLQGILLDIKMPVMNGLELLQYVKNLKNSPPIVIITGYQSVETAAESLKAGAVNYITKPFRSETVIRTLEQVIS
jgi:DNA-binding NtrC family response regulator